jgi:hypothetical protein
MAISERDVATRRLRRAEHDRLIDSGMVMG